MNPGEVHYFKEEVARLLKKLDGALNNSHNRVLNRNSHKAKSRMKVLSSRPLKIGFIARLFRMCLQWSGLSVAEVGWMFAAAGENKVLHLT